MEEGSLVDDVIGKRFNIACKVSKDSLIINIVDKRDSVWTGYYYLQSMSMFVCGDHMVHVLK